MDKKTDIVVEDIFRYAMPVFADLKTFLPIITIYDKPLDYPKEFVARLFFIRQGIVQATNVIMLADSLDELKNKIPNQMQTLSRQKNDDPKLVGVYL